MDRAMGKETAIRPGKKVTVHFRRKHKSKEDELQRIIQLAAAAATTVASTGGLVDPYMADLPADDNTPIQQLAVQEGLCCSECWYLTISQQLMSQHWIANQEDSSAEDGRPQHDGLSSWTEEHDVGLGPDPGPQAGRESLIHDGWETHIAAYEARITAEDVERCRTIDHKPGIDFESPLGPVCQLPLTRANRTIRTAWLHLPLPALTLLFLTTTRSSRMPLAPNSSANIASKCADTLLCWLRTLPLWALVIALVLLGALRSRLVALFTSRRSESRRVPSTGGGGSGGATRKIS
ncbi:uncharacterized protein B0I36DRAFT_369826 [Microdochium trichocladiopsis]|uniref:Uncharacterized protein n=1 Tax=Microdochium trichocladiopsis TaxID=1682393 RepID=A0A9P8XRD4_9PEZI|nr:uncharacterized protein B0I36DRAFT_369826 [Microdochium trichocladiopsis]KAH7012705.1 hypothetical protein B0I36DRAFT_369826 [Microdochium trichocladiopsis]